jgi:hypothetical protein
MTVWEIIELTMNRMVPRRDQKWLAAELGVTAAAIHEWKKTRVPPARYRAIAEKIHISIDQLEGLEPLPWDRGWPFPDIEQDRFWQLGVKERDQVQAKVLELIEQLEQARQRSQGGQIGVSGTHLFGEVRSPAPSNTNSTKKTKKPRKPRG